MKHVLLFLRNATMLGVYKGRLPSIIKTIHQKSQVNIFHFLPHHIATLVALLSERCMRSEFISWRWQVLFVEDKAKVVSVYPGFYHLNSSTLSTIALSSSPSRKTGHHLCLRDAELIINKVDYSSWFVQKLVDDIGG